MQATEVLSPEATSHMADIALKKMTKTLDVRREKAKILQLQVDREYCEHEVRALFALIDQPTR